MSDLKDVDGKSTAVVAVAVKNAHGRGSKRAVKWAAEKLNGKADLFVLIHVMTPVTTIPTPSGERIPIRELDSKVVKIYLDDTKSITEEIFTPFKKLMKKSEIQTLVLEGDNPASTLLSYISAMGIKTLVVGSCSSKISWFRSKPQGSRVPSAVLKNALPPCTILVVDKHRIISNTSNSLLCYENGLKVSIPKRKWCFHILSEQKQFIYHAAALESRGQKILGSSTSSDIGSLDSCTSLQKYSENCKNMSSIASNSEIALDCSSLSIANSVKSDIQAEVERLRQELRFTRGKYNQACEDLVYAQNKVNKLSFECKEEERRVSDAQKREETHRNIAAKEKEKHLEAIKEVQMAKNMCSKESQKRQIAELKAMKESLEKKKVVEELLSGDNRYRRYSREEIELATNFFSDKNLIGEGSFGKVYKCSLYHTPVAVKVLSSDRSEKKEEFLREIEVLSQLRHPHIVLLLGACPEAGCLVYEYMENGSLEDYILPRSTKSPLPWSVRFRIAYEIACGLAFLHNSKPAPIIHRDLKPGNILLGRNFISKISDAGLAKIVPEVVPDNVTEYRNTFLAGTIYYLDPEYQRTGTVRPKSDLYALGVILLQLLANCNPNGIIMKFESALTSGSLDDVLDKSQPDLPLSESEELARIALDCCKLRCRDRPDLDTRVLPILQRLASFADSFGKSGRDSFSAPNHYFCPVLQEIMDDPYVAADGFTYEYIAIKAWLDRHNVSPVTKGILPNKVLTPNHVLRSAIREWRLLLNKSGGRM